MPDAVAEHEPDGRRARRERNRIAVIDAVFALLTEGHSPPAVEDVAERAQVSVSSVFRYFDSLDDLLEETIQRYFERFAELFEVPEPPDDDLDSRVAALVGARLRLYEAIAPIARVARVRAADNERISDALESTRRSFMHQVRDHLAADVRGLSRADADDRIALIDALTAFESWDLLQGTHGRGKQQIRRAWIRGIRAILG